MRKSRHEVRDGIHGFIEFDNTERELIDSRPFQRLRSIHQLAMTSYVYPGATHRRFEHSLGVMEVAGRIFKHLFSGDLKDTVRERVGDELRATKDQWLRVLRAAALLHDIGHLPFSHAAEKDLLPDKWDHERLTAELIRSPDIADILTAGAQPIRVEDVVDLAWSPKDRAEVEPEFKLSPWKSLLNEIITGNTFGADRMDYLLRDSWHVGVSYGRFDPDRLVSGLQVIVNPDTDDVSIGLDIGAIHSAEALLLARYFMYTQVYMHEVRRVYDYHLKQFLQAWLPGGRFEPSALDLLGKTDDEVFAAMREACAEKDPALYPYARRIMEREHFRTVYTLLSPHKKKRPNIVKDIHDALAVEFGPEMVAMDTYGPKSEANDFWVGTESGTLQRSREVSDVIRNVPAIEIGLVFVDESVKEAAESSIATKFKNVLSTPKPKKQ